MDSVYLVLLLSLIPITIILLVLQRMAFSLWPNMRIKYPWAKVCVDIDTNSTDMISNGDLKVYTRLLCYCWPIGIPLCMIFLLVWVILYTFIFLYFVLPDLIAKRFKG